MSTRRGDHRPITYKLPCIARVDLWTTRAVTMSCLWAHRDFLSASELDTYKLRLADYWRCLFGSPVGKERE